MKRLPLPVGAMATASALALVLSACGSDGTSALSDDTPSATPSAHSQQPDPSRGDTSSSSQHSKNAKPGTSDGKSSEVKAGKQSQVKVLDSLPGSSAPRCVAVDAQTSVRSGDLAMGDFAQAKLAFKKAATPYNADPSSFYVIASTKLAHSVTVVATRVGGSQAPVLVHSKQVEEAAHWKYFPIQIQIPANGMWRFRVTAGGAHGCFDAAFST